MSTTAELEIQTPADLADEAPGFLGWARQLTVTDAETFADAGERLKEIKGALNRAAAFFKPMKQKADATKKAILDAEKELTVPLQEAEQLCKRAMLTYQQAEEEKAQAEARRIQAEADEKARREREALERKAAAAKKPETQQRYAEAAAQVTAPVVQVASAAPKLNGVAVVKTWRAQVVDPLKVPREFLLVDEKKLDQYARTMKENAKVDGVRFYQDATMSAKGR